MTPAARLQAAIAILSGLDQTRQAADRYLREWARAHRFAGSKDRAAVAERVYDVLRHRASYAWRMGADAARALVIASLLAEGKTAQDVETLFSGDGYGPPPLNEAERAATAAPPIAPAPAYVRGDYPEWLEPELTRAFGPHVVEEMEAMRGRAPVDLRANSLRAERRVLLTGLAGLDVKAAPTPYAPWGIRIESASGLSALQNSQFFQTGAFEFQDEASQIASLLCGAKPGDRVLDLAAGGGGKALALAAAMADRGEILAFDDKPERLREVGPRARRAGATIITRADSRGGPLWGDGKFDIVLVDAPCSGSGSWRRNPEAKWRLTPERLKELTGIQNWLIDDGARHTRPGGRLVYATCSLLPAENEDVIASFLARPPDFRPVEAAEIWRNQGFSPVPGLAQTFRSSPRATGTDGFFVAVLQRG
jgi:16S rRNA (cytosine967-C5)-methyltransferase